MKNKHLLSTINTNQQETESLQVFRVICLIIRNIVIVIILNHKIDMIIEN